MELWRQHAAEGVRSKHEDPKAGASLQGSKSSEKGGVVGTDPCTDQDMPGGESGPDQGGLGSHLREAFLIKKTANHWKILSSYYL